MTQSGIVSRSMDLPSLFTIERKPFRAYFHNKIVVQVDMAIPVSVSERAARRIAKILQGEPSGSMLRISVEGGGCSGFQYKFGFDSERHDDDFAIVREGATVLIDEISLQYMDGAELDYVEDLIGSAFKINNPQAVAACGCGTSFSV
jgi:iron-sulfur cluster assembly accessory protein